jgi:hypothetical protein
MKGVVSLRVSLPINRSLPRACQILSKANAADPSRRMAQYDMLRFLIVPSLVVVCVTMPPDSERPSASDTYKELVGIKSGSTSPVPK